MRMRLLTLMVPAAALFAAGCGDTTIDHKKAEKFVKGVFNQAPKSVDCPSGVKAKKGGTLTCDVTAADGSKLKATLHMTDAKGHVTISPSDVKPAG